MKQKIKAKDWYIKTIVPTVGFSPVEGTPIFYMNFFEPLPPMKAGKNEVPLKNEAHPQ